MTAWRCPRGHIIGEVVRTHGAHRLAVYRHADETTEIAVVLTSSADVYCSVCGVVRHWQDTALIEQLFVSQLTTRPHL